MGGENADAADVATNATISILELSCENGKLYSRPIELLLEQFFSEQSPELGIVLELSAKRMLGREFSFSTFVKQGSSLEILSSIGSKNGTILVDYSLFDFVTKPSEVAISLGNQIIKHLKTQPEEVLKKPINYSFSIQYPSSSL